MQKSQISLSKKNLQNKKWTNNILVLQYTVLLGNTLFLAEEIYKKVLVSLLYKENFLIPITFFLTSFYLPMCTYIKFMRNPSVSSLSLSYTLLFCHFFSLCQSVSPHPALHIITHSSPPPLSLFLITSSMHRLPW